MATILDPFDLLPQYTPAELEARARARCTAVGLDPDSQVTLEIGYGATIETPTYATIDQWRNFVMYDILHQFEVYDLAVNGPKTYYEASDTTENTSSTTDVLLSGMVVTVTDDGNYLVNFDGVLEGNSNNRTIFYSVYINGVQDAFSERERFIRSNMTGTQLPAYTKTLLAGLSAGDVIDIRWRVSGGSADFHNRSITAQRVRLT